MATTSRTSLRRVEKAIQRSLCGKKGFIRTNYPHVVIVPTGGEEHRFHMEEGYETGIADIILLYEKNYVLNVFFLEIKTKKGNLRNSQIEWKNDRYDKVFPTCTNKHYAIGYGLSDCKKIIEETI